MPPFATDTFTGSVAAISARAADSGGNWTEVTGGGQVISLDGSGRAHRSGGGSTTGRWVLDETPPSADYASEMIAQAANGSGPYFGVGVRCTAGDDGYYGVLDQDGQAASIWKYAGGSLSVLDTDAFTVTVGVDYTMRLEVQGTSLVFKVGGVTVCTATDSSISAAGFPGLNGFAATTSSSQGFSITSINAEELAVVSGDPPLALVVGDANHHRFIPQFREFYAPIFISAVGSEVEPSISFFSHFNVFGLSPGFTQDTATKTLEARLATQTLRSRYSVIPAVSYSHFNLFALPPHYTQDALQKFLAARNATQIIVAKSSFTPVILPKWTPPVLVFGLDSRYQTQAQAVRYSYTNNVHVVPTASYTPPVTPPSTLRSKKKGFFFEIWP